MPHQLIGLLYFLRVLSSGNVRGVCNFLSMSCHNKNLDVKALGVSLLSDRLCLSSQTDQCYSSMLQLSFIQKIKENTSSRCEGMPTQKTRKEEREPWPFGSSFICFFSSPLGLPYVNWASQGCCLFYLRSSLWSQDFPLFYFCRLSPSLSFSHCYFVLLFPILTT